MLGLIIILLAIVSAYHLNMLTMHEAYDIGDLNNIIGFDVSEAWHTVVEDVIYFVKYVPTGFYMYKFIKDIYLASQERIKQKQIELEDIQLQIQIVQTKLSVREAEFTERSAQLQRGVERLRRVQMRVRDIIAADDTLRQTLAIAVKWDEDHDKNSPNTPQEDHTFIVELLKEMIYDRIANPERREETECGEHLSTDPNTSENSEMNSSQDCHVKIVKVTNVYKVAYLKHYIKQKKLRRATQQAMLMKKMESIKQLLEGWQTTLNTVTNSRLNILDIDVNPMDVASQEAMGDYSKPRDLSDSDSDVRNNWPDMYYDEHNSGVHNPYKPYGYYEEADMPVARECMDIQEHGDTNDCLKAPNMMSIVEETTSQMAIEALKSEAGDDHECHDLIQL